MTIGELTGLIDGKIICCEEKRSELVEHAFASDLMSDVLTVEKENLVLITGLANLQVIRTAEMAEIGCIVFGRDKKVGADIIDLAKQNNMVLVESPHSVFHISGELYKAGLKSIY
ncbi:MAG: hypothetical protein MUE32_08105 [Bacteroidales bacterium]|jgi:hypothetical protein|nr:hypothetical protein [Bacteroidales bacterium]